MSFSTSYSDIGLWASTSFPRTSWTLMIWFTSPWRSGPGCLLHLQISRWESKESAQSWASPRFGRHYGIAEDIGRQLVTSGRRLTPKQIENAVDAVTPTEIKRVAQKYLWDKDVSDSNPPYIELPLTCFQISIAALGSIEAFSITTASVLTCRPWYIRQKVCFTASCRRVDTLMRLWMQVMVGASVLPFYCPVDQDITL